MLVATPDTALVELTATLARRISLVWIPLLAALVAFAALLGTPHALRGWRRRNR